MKPVNGKSSEPNETNTEVPRPRRSSIAQNALLTIQLLLAMALAGGLLWAFETWKSAS